MHGTDLNVIERPCDGRGKCLLGVRRLTRVKPATSSPERQREKVLTAAASVGAHIIGWVIGILAGVSTRQTANGDNLTEG